MAQCYAWQDAWCVLSRTFKQMTQVHSSSKCKTKRILAIRNNTFMPCHSTHQPLRCCVLHPRST
jgi:hypothetical protein